MTLILPLLVAIGVQSENLELARAIGYGNLTEVKRLIKAGHKPSPIWLHYVAKAQGSVADREAILGLLLGTKPVIGQQHQYIILNIAKDGTPRMVEMLVDYGMSPDTLADVGGSALHTSIQGRRLDILRVLLKKGASATMACRCRGMKNYQGLALDTYPINLAAYLGWQDGVDELMKHGAKINFQNQRGESPLHAAVLGNTGNSFIKYLISKGATKALKNKSGQTAFDIAIAKKNKVVAAILKG